MWLLVVLCVGVSCEADLAAVSAEFTEELCDARGEAINASHGATWLCVKDLQVQDEWSTFE
jgi:hypothetical protein